MEPVRVGIVGLGQISQIMHIPYLHTMPGFDLTAICDLSPRLVEEIGDLYHVSERYVDAYEMIARANIDAVAICSNLDHADIALCAIEHARHVFVEKPLCESPVLAREIAIAGDRAGVKVMVAYMKRYDPGFWRWQKEIRGLRDIRLVRAHDFCHNNNLVIKDSYDLIAGGDVSRAQADAAMARAEARYREALGGSPPPHILNGYRLMLGLGVHDMTIVRGSFGDPKAVLSAHVAREGAPTTVAILEYDNFCCSWEIGNTDTKQMDQELAVWCRDAMISLRFASPYIRNIPTELTMTRMTGEETVTSTVVAAYRESFQNELAHFHECVTQDRKPLTDAWEGLRDIEWLLEIVKKAWKPG